MQPSLEERPVLAIGAAGLDVVARIDGESQAEISSPARIRTSYGGAARNVAENLARLGQPVSLFSILGADQNGDGLLAYTQSSGVDMSHIHRTNRHPTAFYMAVLEESGQKRLTLDDMRILEELTDSYLAYHQESFQSAALIFIDANLPAAAMQSVFQLAEHYKIPVCADPTSPHLASRLFPYLGQLRMVCPNAREAAALTGRQFAPSDQESAVEVARSLVSKGSQLAIVTLGEYGLCYATSETSGHIPAIHTSVYDPIGAGDALIAAVIFALLNGIEIDDATRLGIAAASLTLRHEGTVAPHLTLEGLYNHLRL